MTQQDKDNSGWPAEQFGRQPASEERQQLPSVCPECGQVFTRQDTFARCEQCQPSRGTRPSHAWTKGSPESRGYDYAWRKLSRRARALQPFCSDCGSVHDLTADHTPEAWERKAAGKVIRLQDVDVVCRRCNSDRGAARGDNPTEHHRPADGLDA